MRLRKVLAVLIFSLACISAKSQDIRLKGKLTDKTDKSAIAGATIKLTSQRDSTKIRQLTTDQSGAFEIGNLNAGMYVLRISYSGYEIIEQRINIQASNITPLSFSVAKVTTDLGEVT